MLLIGRGLNQGREDVSKGKRNSMFGFEGITFRKMKCFKLCIVQSFFCVIGKCLIYFRNIRVKIVKKNENIGDLVYIFEKMYVIICSVVIL